MRAAGTCTVLSAGLYVAFAAAAGPTVSSYQWGDAAIGGGGFVTQLATHVGSGRILAGTDVGGGYMWNVGATRWSALLDGTLTDPGAYNLFGVEDLAADPTDASGATLWVALGQYGGWSDCCGIFKSSNGGASFVQMYPAAGASMDISSNDTRRRQGPRFAIDPQNGGVLFYGTRAEGLLTTTNGGTSWSAATFPGAVGDVSAVAFDPASGTSGTPLQTNGVWAAVGFGKGTGLYHRAAAGGSFVSVAYPTGLSMTLSIQRLASDAAGNLYLSLASYAGTTQTDPGEEPDSPTGGAVWKVAYTGGTFTWTNVTPVANKAYTGIDVAPGTSGARAVVAVAQQCASYACPVYISGNAGGAWATYSYRSPADMNEIVVAGISAPWFTSPGDPGSSAWSAYPSALKFDPNDSAHQTVLLSDYFGVWKGLGLTPTGATATWHNVAANDEEIQPYQIVAPPPPPSGSAGRLLVGAADVDGFRLTDPAVMPSQPLGPFVSGTTSKVQTNDLVGVTSGLDFYEADASHMIRVGVGNGAPATAASFSTDNGQTWTFYNALPSGQVAGQVALAPLASSAAAIAVWAPRGNSAGVYYSANANGAAATWTLASSAPKGSLGDITGSAAEWNYNEPLAADRYASGTPGDCTASFTGCIFYLYNKGTFYRSVNRGATWAAAATLLSSANFSNHPWVRVIGNPYTTAVGDVWVAVADPYFSQGVSGIDGLYHSSNQGSSFSAISAVNAAYLIAIGPPVASGSAYALYLYGRLKASPAVASVYRSDDAGASWTAIFDASVNGAQGFADYPCTMAAERAGPAPGGIYVGTCGRGIVYGQLTTTSAPNAPSNLTATYNQGTVLLGWTDNSSNETGFVVQRQTGSGGWGTLTTLGANATTYTDTTVAGATTYSYRVYATNAAGNSAYSNTASVATPGLPAAIAASAGTPQTATVSTAFAAPLSALVSDGAGHPVAGVVVTFSAPASGASASLSATTATTDANGIASVSATANKKAGHYIVNASVAGLGSPAPFDLTNKHAPVKNLVAANGPAFSGTAGLLLATSPQVALSDVYGNPVPGATVTFATQGSDSGSVSGATQTSDANGLATLGAWTLDADPGTDELIASCADLTGVEVAFTAAGAAVLDVAVALSANRRYVPVGGTLQLSISLTASGPSNARGVHVTDTLPAQLDAANASWTCAPQAGATCPASGTGDIDMSVDLPTGSRLDVVLAAPVLAAGIEQITDTATANVAGDTNADDDTASVLAQRVIFRDGFERG